MSFDEPLLLENVSLYEKENAFLHHTLNFEMVHMDPPTPVLRRGQVFTVALRFNRDYVHDKDVVRLVFNFGPNPDVFRGTRGVNTVTNNTESEIEPWGVRMVESHGIDLTVEVKSPYDSPVGIWQLNIEMTMVDWEYDPREYNYGKDIYLLFNPWIKEDTVYMDNELLLDEYVLNDVGKIWMGDIQSERSREWIFGQFDKCILPACQLLLDRSGLNSIARGDPVLMTRAISKIVNSNDDRGVVVGRWNGCYDDGEAPSSWTGSIPILEQFLETAAEVKYGQCWVFGGVVTTVCRALGIPSRVVTNFSSAHDTDASFSVDRFYSRDMAEVQKNDSIWNYHVWNEVWMARQDLPSGYGGWQAIDATPQETSNGFFQCGPAPVEAIKHGAVGFNYDIGFMYASVNADVFSWIEDPESDLGYSKIDVDKQKVGKMLVTKAPWIYDPNGNTDKEDITATYKWSEGTDDERIILYRVVNSSEKARQFYAMPSAEDSDVEFGLEDIERINIGEPFKVIVHIKNNSAETRTVHAILSAGSVYYTGVKANLVKKASGDFVIEPYATEHLQLDVEVEEYLPHLVEYCMMKLYAIATVLETKQTWAKEDDFQILKPSINVKTEGDLIVGRPAAIILSFKNPLKLFLTQCKFNYAGPGISKNQTIEYRDIEPEEDIYIEHQLIPRKSGEQKIVATFTSKELLDITGSAVVEVLDEDE